MNVFRYAWSSMTLNSESKKKKMEKRRRWRKEEEGTNLVRSECIPDDHFTILRGGDNMSFVEGRPVKTENFTNMTL